MGVDWEAVWERIITHRAVAIDRTHAKRKERKNGSKQFSNPSILPVVSCFILKVNDNRLSSP